LSSSYSIGWIISAACGLITSARVAVAQTPADSAPTAGSLRDRAAIEEVLRGKRTTANAAWWGFDASDSTQAVQSAINSGAAKVVVPYVGQPWIVRPLHLASDQEIIFEPGVVLWAKAGEFHGPYDCLLSGKEVKNVTLRGYNAVLRMRKADYVGPGYPKAEWRHTLELKGAKNVKVFGLTLESSGGDGIFVGSTWDERRVPCEAILIRDCVSRDHHRQGISVISVAGLRIENCLLQGTRGTAPQSGIDIEPDHSRERLSDIEMTNCTIEGNAGGGIMVNLTRLDNASTKVSIRVIDCLVRSSGGSGLCLLLHGDARPTGAIEFLNCTFENTDYAGAHCVWNVDSPMKIQLTNCRWYNVARRASEGPIHLELHGAGSTAGAIRFADCSIFDDQLRPILRLIAPETTALQEVVRGEISVFSERATNADPQVSKRLSQLQIRQRKRGE